MPSARKKAKSLQHGRPKTLTQRPNLVSASSATTARIIRTHHRLHKQHATALKNGDEAAAREIAAQLEAQGGLQAYQAASVTGQSAARGGDSSRQLMQWLDEFLPTAEPSKQFRLLEVGALAVDNACSRSRLFEVTRIDLNSRQRSILQQDFMERPLPTSGHGGDDERFHVISLSLVLNYVPESKARGQMLARVTKFLLSTSPSGSAEQDQQPQSILPALFLVLPAPCVTNSRYLDDARLQAIMTSLGFACLRRKLSAKLVYYLFRWRREEADAGSQSFPKVEVNPGRTRNNFCVVLEPGMTDT